MYPDGDDYNIIRISHTMSTAKFMDEYTIDKEKVYEVKCINKTIANGINTHSLELNLFQWDIVSKICNYTPLQEKCMQFKKGCSFITKKLKQERILKKGWTHALAWKTWREDHNILISAKDWGHALMLVSETKIANEIKWLSFTIFYRTCWTGVKQAASTKR